MKKLLMLAVTTAALGVPVASASASCTPNPTDLGPACLETAICNAANAVKNVDCVD